MTALAILEEMYDCESATAISEEMYDCVSSFKRNV